MKLKHGIASCLMVSMVLLAACEAPGPHRTQDKSSVLGMQTDLEQARKDTIAKPSQSLEESQAALVRAAEQESMPTGSQERFDISVNDAPAAAFFMGLVRGAGSNMVVHPDVTGNITLDLRQVTVDEVLEVTRNVYGYSYSKAGGIYQIFPSGLRAEVFRINYLNMTRQGSSDVQVSAGQISDAKTQSVTQSSEVSRGGGEGGTGFGGSASVNGTKISTHSDADFWAELEKAMGMLVGSDKGQSIVITPQTGVMVVKALPDELAAVRDYLTRTDLILRRQVIIEARVLEVSLSDGFQAGINWSAMSRPGDGKTLTFTTDSKELNNPDNIGGVFGVAAELTDFSGMMNLLETQGSVQVLSSPRISTMNNQKAVIKVGTDEFFVTKVSSDTTTSTGGTTSSPTVELTPFFSGIALDVTPQISEDEEVVLHIHPTVSQVEDQTKTIDTGESGILKLPLALSSIRETDSVVYAKSGQVVVIGGLMQDGGTDTNAGTPFLERIPLLGYLFKQKRSSSTKSELVILIKSTVIGPDGWSESLRGSSENVKTLRDKM